MRFEAFRVFSVRRWAEPARETVNLKERDFAAGTPKRAAGLPASRSPPVRSLLGISGPVLHASGATARSLFGRSLTSDAGVSSARDQ